MYGKTKNIVETGVHPIGTLTLSSKSDLPAYFNIDPEAAASRLTDPIDTARFAKAAAFGAKGRDDLAKEVEEVRIRARGSGRAVDFELLLARS